MRGALAISAVAVGLAVAAIATGTTTRPAPAASPPLPPQEENPRKSEKPNSTAGAATYCRAARSSVPFYRQLTWTWQERHPAQGLADRTPLVKGKSCHWSRYAMREWAGRERSARTRYRSWFTRTYEKFRCIHEHEGAWTDPNGPYYGGVQMDIDFQRAYGSEFLERWGTADKWPIWAQLIAAERAYRVRGFGPWPTYYRYCG